MTELQTILGKNIPLTTRGIVYLCIFDRIANTLTVAREILFDCPGTALEAYANIPNPESQIASGGTYNDLIKESHELHAKIKDPVWVKELADYI